jgi:tetratricopeptide (TPR) repeat protein
MADSPILEKIMRFAVPAVALSLALLTVSSVSFGKRQRDDQISPASAALTQIGLAHITQGKFNPAHDALESALILDPRNRSAYVGLATLALKQDLPGKAIRLYREALLLEPNDVVALAGQGEAMVAKGAVMKAKDNLARIARLCSASCPEQARLAAVIDKGAPVPPKAIATESVTPKPVVIEAVPPPKP